MKKVFHKETTTDGKILLYCSTGENTGDVEIIEMDSPFKDKDCDCEYDFVISDKGFCSKCEKKFYKKVFN